MTMRSIGKSKSIRQIIAYFVLLSVGLLAAIGITTEAVGCVSDNAQKYAGMYFTYPNELGHMWILVETDTGVDDDYNHRRIHFEYDSSCNEPNWEYHHYDYDYWDDGSGIPGFRDRRLWLIKASNLSPDCFYDVRFKYRDYYSAAGEWLSGCWSTTWGHFHSAPQTSSTNPDHIPHDLEFYAFGDTRPIDDNGDLSCIAKQIMAHNGKKTFILHTGDFVYQGGRPVGSYWFRNGHKSNGDPEPWLLHYNDWWRDNFFGVHTVWEMLRHLPIFPAFGNHEFMDSAVNHKYGPANNPANIKYNTDAKQLTYNYTHYFRNSGHGVRYQDMYYGFAYGPAQFYSLTSYPMDDPGKFCSDTNANYRPRENRGYYRIGWDVNSDGTVSSWTDPQPIPGGFGDENQGGGISAGDINGKGTLDLIQFHIYDPSGEDRGYYRIGWDVDSTDGTVSSWTDPHRIYGGFGDDIQGGGISAGDINGKGTLDLIQFHIYDPSGEDRGYYRIGWDVDSTDGTVSSWTDPHRIYGGWGDDIQGGGISAGDIDGKGTLDLIQFHIYDPSGGNRGYYRIGWNVDKAGTVSSWTDPHQIPGWFGDESQGGGISAGYINNNNTLDLIAFHIDNPSGGNHGYYRIGWDVDKAAGTVSSWTDPHQIPGWFGDESQGGGISAGYINNNNTLDLIAFHIENPTGTGQYDWLKRHLEDSEDDPRQWKIVMMHAPMYSPCSCNNQKDARTYLKPLFEKHGVDLFLSGHEHYYAHKTVNDIPYLILGGGGASVKLCDKCGGNDVWWSHECNGYQVASEHHFAHFHIIGDQMTIKVLDKWGGLIDKIDLDKTPEANFNFDPKEADPLTVKFTDTSKGNRYEYVWDFGDGHTLRGKGSDASTEHTYTEKRTYTVKLTIKSAYNSDTKPCIVGVGEEETEEEATTWQEEVIDRLKGER